MIVDVHSFAKKRKITEYHKLIVPDIGLRWIKSLKLEIKKRTCWATKKQTHSVQGMRKRSILTKCVHPKCVPVDVSPIRSYSGHENNALIFYLAVSMVGTIISWGSRLSARGSLDIRLLH